MNRRGVNRNGQVTFFVIIAIVVIALFASYYVFKDQIFTGRIPEVFQPIEKDFLSCVEDKAVDGVQILSSQGGYIEMPEFVPGSNYMPFSSELNFFGISIPYWYFIGGNNIPYENVPSISDMESELEAYLDTAILDCSLEKYTLQGYLIQRELPESEVSIKDKKIEISLKMNLNLKKDSESVLIEDHEVEVETLLGSLYDDAIEFYDKEQKEMFLENYSIDFLRNYAPVDGIELSCAPITWNANEIFRDIREANEANFLMMKNRGEEEDYFTFNLNIDSDIRIINSRNWPNSYEVLPSDSPILIAEPVGNQQGLGILGFCYVPYHFVYNIRYPLLVQLEREGQVFQFPWAIIIEGNLPRESKVGRSVPSKVIDICEDKVSEVFVSVFNSDLELIDANVSFECLSSSCDIGETTNGGLKSNFPQCVNGNLVVKKEGYKDFSTLFSSVNGGVVTVVLEKEYEKEVSLILGGELSNERAIITFSTEDFSQTILYPEQKKVLLAEGSYDLDVYVYEESSIKFPETKKEQCYEVPSSNVLGLLGFTQEECTEIVIPEQEISNVLIGGGSGSEFIGEVDLESDSVLKVVADRFATPKSLDQLQANYILLEVKEAGVEF